MPRDAIVCLTVDEVFPVWLYSFDTKKKTWRVTDSRWVVNNTYNKHGVPKISLSNILPSRAFIHSCSITISINLEIQSFFLVKLSLIWHGAKLYLVSLENRRNIVDIIILRLILIETEKALFRIHKIILYLAIFQNHKILEFHWRKFNFCVRS